MIAVFCFYKKSTGKQARLAFSKEFRHCHVILYDGDVWMLFEWDSTGIHGRRLKVKSCARLVSALKTIDDLSAVLVVDIKEMKFIYWKPWIIRSCNELSRYLSGVDTGLTWNPKDLFNKLIRHDKSNYDILIGIRRGENGIFRPIESGKATPG